MLSYIARRLLSALPLLWAVATLSFFLVELAPGDAAGGACSPGSLPGQCEAARVALGLDDPLGVRYLRAVSGLLWFDLGTSIVQNKPVAEIIARSLPNTLLLSGTILLIAFPSGIALGTLQALKRGTWLDTGLTALMLLLYSMPAFWLAIMAQQLFSLYWPILPSSGMVDDFHDFMDPSQQLWDRATHLVLPGLAMGLAQSAAIARYMRSSLLETLSEDFVRTARAKGLPERVVIGRHAMRNALKPVVTIFGLSLPFLFSGSVIIEYIFAWPGMGREIINAIYTQDTPLITGCFFCFAGFVVIGNLFADVLNAAVDPRIRAERAS